MSYATQPAGLTALEAALSWSGVRPVVVVEITFGAIQYLFAGSSLVDDTGRVYSPRLLASSKFVRSLTGGTNLMGSPSYTVSGLSFDNSDGALDALVGAKDATVSILLAASSGHDGQPLSSANWQPRLDAEIREIVRTRDGVLNVIVRDGPPGSEGPLPAGRYLRYGSAALLPTAFGQSDATSDPAYGDAAVTYMVAGRLKTVDFVGSTVLFGRGAGGIRIDANRILLVAWYFGSTYYEVLSTFAVALDEFVVLGFSATGLAATVFLLHETGTLDTETLTLPSTYGLGVDPLGSDLRMNTGADLGMEFADARIYDAALSVSEIRVAASDPSDATIPNLAGHWTFEEATGLVAEDSIGPSDFTLQTGSTWTASRTGDRDPDATSGGLTRPYLAGNYAWHAPLPLIDSTSGEAHKWGLPPNVRVRKVFADGAPAAPRFTYTGSATFDASANTVLITEDAFALVGRQNDIPLLQGQDLEISGSASNSGTYDVVSVDPLGTLIVIEADGGGPPGLVNETSGAVTVKTPDALWRYESFLPNEFEGYIEGRWVDGRVITAELARQGSNLMSLAWEDVAGVTPSKSAVTFDPFVGYYDGGSRRGTDRAEVLTKLLASGFCWRRRVGLTDELITAVPPLASAAVAHILASDILSLEELETVELPSSLVVHYAKNYAPLTSFPSSVPSLRQQRLKEKFLTHSRPTSNFDNPDAKESETETLLTRRAGAAQRAQLEDAMRQVPRWFRVVVRGALPIFEGDVLLITALPIDGLSSTPAHCFEVSHVDGGGDTELLLRTSL